MLNRLPGRHRGKPPSPPPSLPAAEVLENAALRAVAKLDAAMAAYVRAVDAAAERASAQQLAGPAVSAVMWQRSQSAWRHLSDGLLEARTVLTDAVKEAKP